MPYPELLIFYFSCSLHCGSLGFFAIPLFYAFIRFVSSSLVLLHLNLLCSWVLDVSGVSRAASCLIFGPEFHQVLSHVFSIRIHLCWVCRLTNSTSTLSRIPWLEHLLSLVYSKSPAKSCLTSSSRYTCRFLCSPSGAHYVLFTMYNYMEQWIRCLLSRMTCSWLLRLPCPSPVTAIHFSWIAVVVILWHSLKGSWRQVLLCGSRYRCWGLRCKWPIKKCYL